MFEFGNQDFSRIFNRASKCIAAVLIIAYGEISQAQHAAQSRIRVRGTPRVIHYTRNDFDSDPQIWAMCQDREGILYFGSNKGALIFNGETWQTVRLPNNSSVRSLAVNSQGVVLAGGFNEFGAVRKDEYGRYYYDSWTHLLRTEDRNIENVWAIHEVQGHMVFRSYKMLIAISGNKAVTLPTSGMYEYSAVLNNNLFVTDGAGVKSVDLDKLEFDHVIADDDLRQENFLSIVPGYGEEQVFVITKEGSFFELDRNGGKPKFLFRVLPVNANNLLTCTLKASGGHYYVGTLSSKVILVTASATGQVDTEIFHDLQDNTVHNLFETR
ncbi:MAG TPA: two-component regulator propeller domain-containing protein, partial [Chryseosolibacter sp.]|nr:two-component regulator propeller domain-containing protein [Chryseosolibacter sp.]